jgi:hypothetical protein
MDWRPDRCGLLCLREELDGTTSAAVVYEIRPGALESASAGELIEALIKGSAVVVTVSLNGRRARFGAHDCQAQAVGHAALRHLLSEDASAV